MSNVTITPNMNLPVPVPGQEPGPDWANDIVADMNAIDSHDHTNGKGVQVTPDGLNINADLPLNSNNLTTARTTNFDPQSAPIAAAGADTGCLYVSGVDLYYNDGAGNQVRITQGGNVTGSTGTITGLPSGTASASFAGAAFTFESATSTPATMNIGPAVIGAAVASSKTVTLAPNAAMAANYALTFPLVAPEANQIPISDGSGNLSWTRGVIPLGAVIATFPDLSGAYSTSATTVADANGFVKCNGQTIADATSPMNGVVVPNINNTVFLCGGTTSNVSGGAATATLITANLPSHTHGAGSFATSVGVTGGTAALTGTTSFASNAHKHLFYHTHQWLFARDAINPNRGFALSSSNSANTNITTGDTLLFNSSALYGSGSLNAITEIDGGSSSDTNFYTTGVIDPPAGSAGSGAFTDNNNASASVGISSTAASMTGSNSVTGTSGATGSATAFSILPTYITAVYLMRVK